jgi:hypothetical protein
MSSGLETKRDFQVGLEMAWHKETRVTPLVTANDFPDIAPAPLWYSLPCGKVMQWNGTTVPVALDDGLPVGTASAESYTLFTPKQAMGYLCEVLEGTGYQVESLGMIFNRSRWFVTFWLNELQGICPRGEAFKLSASGGLDKSQSPRINLTHTVQVCDNTVQITRSGRSLFSSKLTKNFNSRLQASRDALGQTVGMARIFNETLRGLEAKPTTVDQARAVYAAELVDNGGNLTASRTQNTLDQMLLGFQSGRGNSGSTRLDAVNGLTEVLGQGLRGIASKRDSFSRWESSEFGGNADRKAAFVEAITAPLGWESMVSAGALALADARRGTVIA